MQMISGSTLSQAPHVHASNGHSRYATHHQQHSATSEPRVPSSQSQQDSARPENPNDASNDHEKPTLKRRISEIEPLEGMNSQSSAVRRRISRACDQCNQLRTKCNGGLPCQRCKESNFECKYARLHKKRGRAPKKDYSQNLVPTSENAEHERPASHPDQKTSDSPSTDADLNQLAPGSDHRPFAPGLLPSSSSGMPSFPDTNPVTQNIPNRRNHLSRSASMSEAAASTLARQQFMYGNSQRHPTGDDVSMLGMNLDHPALHGNQILPNPNITPHVVQDEYRMQQYFPSTHHAQGLRNSQLELMHLRSHDDAPGPSRTLPGDSASVAFMGQSPAAPSPAWLNLPSPPFADTAAPTVPRSSDYLRYPVLRPLLPLIESIVPRSLACDLLEVYFTSSSSAQLRPSSPHILGYVFRKKSFLHPTNPRQCSPALLASMLWIAAQTSNAAFLSSHPAARGRVCRRLLELSVDLLKPLIHSPVPGGTSLHGPTNHIIDDVSLGVLGVSTDHVGFEGSVTAQVDVLATYIHLATVVSASERKAASLRWWNAAWSIARELKFNREAPPNPTQVDPNDFQGEPVVPNNDFESEMRDPPPGAPQQSKGFITDPPRRPGYMTEEEREERRRVWWLLYMMDRHLALCYNRPLSLLDKECDALLQPMDDNMWQSGQFPSIDSTYAAYRRRGPNIECTSQSIFGYFLPLMTILGNIVDLNHSRSRPTFGTGYQNPNKWDDHIQEVTHQLELYGQSLQDLDSQASTGSNDHNDNRHNEAPTPSVRSSSTNDSQMMNESLVQRKTTIAYGTHIMHVLHILLAGKWDPITLLDDNDLWISTQSFITATDHAIAAAEAVSGIIEHDPDLSFMPFFFGVYLLQGSFLLLLFADKLQGDVSPNVVKACETVIRAHEACVVTLDTQYQRNFRKVMRSALAQVRGRMAEDLVEQQHWRREVLSLYRWTGDGTGLAL